MVVDLCLKMSVLDQYKWNQRYTAGAYSNRPNASIFLQSCLTYHKYHNVLDLGCGLGRNANFLSGISQHVDAIDISNKAIKKATMTHLDRSNIKWLCHDLDHCSSMQLESYDLFVFIRYLNRELLHQIINHMKPGSEIIIEQHLATKKAVAGPRSEDYKVQPNEIYNLGKNLKCLFYQENILIDPDDKKVALIQCHYKKNKSR